MQWVGSSGTMMQTARPRSSKQTEARPVADSGLSLTLPPRTFRLLPRSTYAQVQLCGVSRRGPYDVFLLYILTASRSRTRQRIPRRRFVDYHHWALSGTPNSWRSLKYSMNRADKSHFRKLKTNCHKSRKLLMTRFVGPMTTQILRFMEYRWKESSRSSLISQTFPFIYFTLKLIGWSLFDPKQTQIMFCHMICEN